jgi:hypothetical protein
LAANIIYLLRLYKPLIPINFSNNSCPHFFNFWFKKRCYTMRAMGSGLPGATGRSKVTRTAGDPYRCESSESGKLKEEKIVDNEKAAIKNESYTLSEFLSERER